MPRHPGVLSAAGLLLAPVEQELSIAFPRPLADLDRAELEAAYSVLDQRCAKLMAGEAVGDSTVEVRHFADICYIGQAYHLEIAIDLGSEDAIDRLYNDFRAAHDRVYGYAAEAPVRLVNLRTVYQAAVAADAAEDDRDGDDRPLTVGTRQILLPDPWGPIEATVTQRAALGPNDDIAGPAIVEQEDTTLLIEPGWQGRSAPGGHLILLREG